MVKKNGKQKTMLVRKKKQPAKKQVQELTRLGSALRTLGGIGGTALGGIFGMPSAGSSFGTGAGAALSKWLGSGDYTVSRNSITEKASNGIPMMHKTEQSIVVRHKEYIGPVSGSTAFTVQKTLQINPGNSVAFPWLSGVAARFQEYKIRGLVFHYVPTSGTAVSGTNSALGSVMIQTSYRSNDSAPTSKAVMMNEYWATESVPADPFCHPIECDPKENPFNIQYVRTGTIPTSDNQLLYDLGVTYVATSGMQSTNVVGDLWASYEIELKKPIVDSNVTSTAPTLCAYFTTPTSTNSFPTTYSTQGDVTVTSVSNQTITFGPGMVGSYLFTYEVQASTTFTAIDLSGATSYVNAVTAYADPVSGGVYYRTVLSGGTPTVGNGFYTAAFTVTDPSASVSLTLPAWTWTGTALTARLLVSPWNF